MQRSLWRQTRNIDPYPLLARSCDRWWPDFVTFTACKRSIFGLKRGKMAQLVSNRCKDLFKRKKDFGVTGTLMNSLDFLLWTALSFLPFFHFINSCCSFKYKMIEKSWREFFRGGIQEINFWGRDTAFCGSAVHLNKLKLQNGGNF